ncbi:chordin-like protein 2 [Littorina saxatilis]|uniref:VWFC domain-containing protein n=1 Tax=Littorina saxatilis TaxID=31220 RepID=A0AAN9G0G7_9CAEN
MVLRLVRPALLLVFSVLVTCARRDRGVFCTLGGKRYRMGETWHPTLVPFGENACINCTCHEGGNVKCQGIDCPRPDCEEPKIAEGECCPSCDIGKEGSKEKEDRRPGCDFDGKTYKDGDVFPSNSTGLRPTRQEQCVICVCAVGKVFCQLKTCLPTKCKKFKSVPDDCCPQCADESDYTDDYRHYLLSDPKQYNRSDADCSTAMGLHRNGSSWHPVIDMIGVAGCITCTCINGNVSCKRLECSALSSASCETPDHPDAPCCRQCAVHKASDRVEVPAGHPKGSKHKDKGKKRKRGRKNRKRKKKGRRKRKKKGVSVRGHRRCKASDREQVHPHRKANVTSVAAILSELCLPRNTDRLVYRGKGDDFEMLAFDNLKTKTVEMLRWEVKKRKLLDTEHSMVLVDEVRPTIMCSQIIGATNKGGFKKLLRKIDSKQKKCKSRGKPCSTRTLEKIIKRDRRLKDLPTQSVCGE